MKKINRTSFKEVKGYENILNSNVINVIENLHDKFDKRILNLRKDRLKVLNYVLSNNESSNFLPSFSFKSTYAGIKIRARAFLLNPPVPPCPKYRL